MDVSSAVTLAQQQHIIKLLKQKFISPYKIIYMVDQQQADYFKMRNIPKNMHCTNNHNEHNKQSSHRCSCSMLSSMLIPYNQQTKLQKIVTDTIINIPNYLNQIMQFCEDRYQNIIKSGKKDNLKVTVQAQKFIIQKIMSESVNNIIFSKVAKKLKQFSESTNTQMGLWATPATWKTKYPEIQLTFFKGQKLKQLHQKGYIEIDLEDKGSLHDHDDLGKFYNSQQLIRELQLLEKDGKFQEYISNRAYQLKNLVGLEKFIMIQQGKYFPQLRNINLLLQSFPFQLNMKMNVYMTICDHVQIVYVHAKQQLSKEEGKSILQSLFESSGSLESHKYNCILNLGLKHKIILKYRSQSTKTPIQIHTKPNSLIILSNEQYELESQQLDFKTNKNGYILQTKLFTACRK